MRCRLLRVANAPNASAPSVRSSGKVLSFSRLTPYLVAFGCVLDLLSTFFPWTAIFRQQRYLPYSIILPLGERVQFLYADFLVLVVVVVVRAAAIVGFGGLVLYVYHKGVLFSLVLIVSMVLSFSSAVTSRHRNINIGNPRCRMRFEVKFYSACSKLH